MPEVKVIDGFSAAHNLRNYRGKCEKLHGHNWKVEIIVGRKKLGMNGMVIDFIDLKRLVKDVLLKLDHSFLNELAYFKTRNPTSENITVYIAGEIKKRLKPPLVLREVRVWETETSCAIWP